MQSPIFEPQQLPELPQPGMVDQYIFESPLMLSILCLTLGLVLYYGFRSIPSQTKLRIPALLIGVFSAVAVFTIGTLIVTDREHLKKQSNDLVQAVANTDSESLHRLLDESIEIRAAFFVQNDKEIILKLLDQQVPRVIESVQVRSINAGLFGERVARTQIKVKVDGDMVPPLSWWSVDWVRPSSNSNDWRATIIEPIWIQGISNPTP